MKNLYLIKKIELLIFIIIGIIVSPFQKRKKIIYIIGPMRSGTTLLKALIATKKNTSHLPEINFSSFITNKYYIKGKLITLSLKKNIILKYPKPFNNFEYKFLPPQKKYQSHIIILIRNVYDVVNSLKKLKAAKNKSTKELVEYWTKSYEEILKIKKPKNQKIHLIKYEDLVKNPKEETKKLFTKLGFRNTNGENTYPPLSKGAWKWGTDDGGEKIKKLKVQKQEIKNYTKNLIQEIKSNKKTKKLMKKFNYKIINQ